MKEKGKTNLIDYFEVIMKYRRFIARNVVLVTAIAIIISFLLTPKFTAVATILPPSPEQEALFTLRMGNIPAGLSGLASMGSLIPGMSTPSDLFAAIMQSVRIREVIINKYALRQKFKAKTLTDALDALDRITEIKISPEGLVSVSVTYKNKQLATDIANSYIEELDKFNTETAMTLGKRYRIFIEERLMDNIDTLTHAEDALKSFQEEHRTVALDVELENVIRTIAELKSNIILLEVKRGALSSSSQFENPYLLDINRELSEMKRQLSKIEFGRSDSTKEFGAGFSVPLQEMPEVALEYARLLRDVKVQEAIYELLTEQYEQAKIMEIKDTPTVQFLDEAHVPDKRTYPKRKVIVFFSFLISFFVSLLIVAAFEYSEKNKQDLQRTKSILSLIYKDIISLKSYVSSLFRRK